MSYSTPYTSAPLPPAGQPHMQPPPPMTAQQTLVHQDSIIRQQDQSLDQLSRSVATLHNLGNEIHGEIRAQGGLLDDLERGVDQTREQLVSQQGRLTRLIKRTRSNWLFFAIILLVIVLGVILYFVISSPG